MGSIRSRRSSGPTGWVAEDDSVNPLLGTAEAGDIERVKRILAKENMSTWQLAANVCDVQDGLVRRPKLIME